MDETAVLSSLAARGHQERASALETLRKGLKRDGRLRIKKLEVLFKLLADLLHDSNWNLRRDTLALITEAIPKTGRRAGEHILVVLPGLINNLGDSKVAIRRGAAAAIKTSLELRPTDCAFAPIVVVEGIENLEIQIRLEMLKCLEGNAVWEAANDEDVLLLVEATTGRLRDVDSDVVDGASVVLQALPDIIGADSLSTCIKLLDAALRDLYYSVVGTSSSVRSSSAISRGEKLAFGFITPALLDELQSGDWEARGVAVEELELTVSRLERTSAVIPHIQSLIDFLASLFTDGHMKVSIGSLEVMGQLVHKVGWPMRSYLNQIMEHVVEMLSDTRVLLRQALAKLISRLMHCLTPMPVLDILLKKLTSDSWRIREEIVSILILSLGQFSRNQFDFKQIIDALSPLLLDTKMRVKCVAGEAFTSIQQLVGDDTFHAYLEQCDATGVISVVEELAHLRTTMAQPRANTNGALSRSAPLSASGHHALGFQRCDSIESLNSVSSKTPRTTAKLPWGSLPSSAKHGNSNDPSRRQRAPTTSSVYADRHKGGGSGRPKSPRQNDNYVPSFADADASPRRERSSSLSASFDKRDSPFPVSAKVARSGSLRRHDSGKVQRDASADLTAWHGESRNSDRSGIPAPVKRSMQSSHGDREGSATSRGAAAASLVTRASTPGLTSRLKRRGSRSSLDPTVPISTTPLRDSPDSDDLVQSRSTDSSRTPSRTLSVSPSRPPSRPVSALSRADSNDSMLGDTTVPTSLVRSPALHEDASYGDGGARSSTSSVFDTSEDEPPAPLRVNPLPLESAPAANRPSRVDLMSPSEFEVVSTVDFASKSLVVSDQNQSNSSQSPTLSPALSDYEAELIAQARGRAGMAHSPSPTRRAPSTVNIGDSAAFRVPPKTKHNFLKARATKVGDKKKTAPMSTANKHGGSSSAAGADSGDNQSGKGTVSPKVGVGMGSPHPLTRSPVTVRKGLPASRKPAMSPRVAKARAPVKSRTESPHKHLEALKKQPESGAGADSLVIDSSRSRETDEPATSAAASKAHGAPNARASPSLLKEHTDHTTGDRSSTPPGTAAAPRPPKHPPAGGKRSNRIRRGSTTTLTTRPTVRTATAETMLVPLASLEPYPTPQTALKDAMAALQRGITQEQWSDACEGLTILRQLLQHSVETILGSLHVVTKAIATEVICLRSITARLAILTVGDLMETLGKSMDKELVLAIGHLVKKIAGDGGSGFIRDEIAMTMGRLRSSGVSKLKILAALLPHHTNKAVAVKQMVLDNINELIPVVKSRALTYKDSELLLVVATKLTGDTDPHIRYNARRTFWLLSELDEFESALHALTGQTLTKAVAVMDKLRKNGLGDPPASTKPRMISAGSRDDTGPPAQGSPVRSTTMRSQNPSRGPSARVPVAPRTTSRNGATASGSNRNGTTSSVKRGGRGGNSAGGSAPMSEHLREELEAVTGKLESTDWQARDTALQLVEDLVGRSGPKLGSGLTKLFDAFALRLTDSNSKVSKHALETCHQILPELADALSSQATILVQLIDNLAPNLASKNKQIRDLSLGALGVMAKSIDNVALLQPLVNAANFGSAKVMQSMVVFISGLLAAVFDTNAKFAKRQIMPLVGRLLGDAKHKLDCGVLCQSLLDCLGDEGLRDAAHSLPPDKKKLLANAIQLCV